MSIQGHGHRLMMNNDDHETSITYEKYQENEIVFKSRTDQLRKLIKLKKSQISTDKIFQTHNEWSVLIKQLTI